MHTGGLITTLTLLLALGALFLLAGCGNAAAPGPPQPISTSYGFETGLDGFTARGLDLNVGGSEINWSITPSDEHVSEGLQSAKFYVENFTDAAKIWLEQEVTVTPDTTYDAQISFDFASQDYGDFNNFTMIAGLATSSPTSAEQLAPLYRDSTGNGLSIPSWLWLPKTYTQTISSGPDGKLQLLIGVWGTWETTRTYYIDKLKLSLTRHGV